jgi:phosphate transport system protein
MSIRLEGHTVQRFDGELSHLHVFMLDMGGLVQNQVSMALEALLKEDRDKAQQVLENELEVDELELKIDQEVVSILARRTPVARDLRTVMACSKMVTDLEQMGDEAYRIASLTLKMFESSAFEPSHGLMHDVFSLGKLVKTMLSQALHSLDRLDDVSAQAIVNDESELDVEFESCMRRLATYIIEDSRLIGHAIRISLVLKALERVGSFSRNIAQQVIYITKGEDIRHQRIRNTHGKSRSEGGKNDISGSSQ